MNSEQSAAASVVYLVHDLGDAAVRRRAAMLRQEGLHVRLAGFHRGPRPPVPSTADGSGEAWFDLGETRDGALGERMVAVARSLWRPQALKSLAEGAEILVARNLEMLVLAWRVKRRRQRLVYECLDIHRLMLGRGLKLRLLRWLERRLIARADLVVVSSPAFAREYFARRQQRVDRVLLVENKVPFPTLAARVRPVPEPAEPIRIGWFGMLRCRRTLEELKAIAREGQGAIEVVIAGIPSPAEFPHFAAEVSGAPRLTYRGPYTAADLAQLYAGVDYVWAIDYFEEGLNSDWLLPNRLYEGVAHGVVPIALRRVETGRWLARHGVGLLLDDAARELMPKLAGMSAQERAAMIEAVRALPAQAVLQTDEERRDIVAAMTGAARARTRRE